MLKRITILIIVLALLTGGGTLFYKNYHPEAATVAMLEELGATLKMYASESKGGMYPPSSIQDGMFVMDTRVFDEGLLDVEVASYLHGGSLKDVCYTGHTLRYLQPACDFIDKVKNTGELFNEKQKRVWKHDFKVPWSDDAHPLKEGSERFVLDAMIRHWTVAEALFEIPILWEMPKAEGGSGGWVLYFDGHAEWVPFPGKFPMVEPFIERIRSLKSNGLKKTPIKKSSIKTVAPPWYRRAKPVPWPDALRAGLSMDAKNTIWRFEKWNSGYELFTNNEIFKLVPDTFKTPWTNCYMHIFTVSWMTIALCAVWNSHRRVCLR